VEQLWVGVDVGKEHHWVVVIDDQGQVWRSGRVANDEVAVSALVGEVVGLGRRLVSAVDLTGVEAALLLTLLWAANHEVRYLPGKALNRAAAGYRSEGKTDAKDVRVLADQARLRCDLQRLGPTEELVVELRLLTSRRAGLVADCTRAINRLRQQLTGICPGLEHTANLGRQRGWLVLLGTYQRPTAIATAGPERLAEFLAAVGDLASFASADHLAANGGQVPVPNDSGKRTGRLHRPQRYPRGLRHVFYLAALTSIRCCPVSGAYYQYKRSQRKGSKTALIALARRLNVWAMLCDRRPYQPATAPAITTPAACHHP
jgi:transposase